MANQQVGSKQTKKQDFHPIEKEFLSKGESYFYKVAFGAEYGSKDEKIKKWAKNIRLKISENATKEEREIVNNVLKDL
jgi:Protein of unknown function (DUF2927).